MKLSAMIQKGSFEQVATATPATVATHEGVSALIQPEKRPTVARVATVAVANPTESTFHGLTLTELKAVAEEDWPDIEHDSLMLDTLAHSLVTRRLREGGEVPPHYTQAVHCDGCGPVWLWQGSPERVQGCPWCFVRVQGMIPPRASNVSGQR